MTTQLEAKRKELGALIKQARTGLGMTGAAFAHEIGTKISNLSGWEAGNSSPASYDDLDRITDKLPKELKERMEAIYTDIRISRKKWIPLAREVRNGPQKTRVAAPKNDLVEGVGPCPECGASTTWFRTEGGKAHHWGPGGEQSNSCPGKTSPASTTLKNPSEPLPRSGLPAPRMNNRANRAPIHYVEKLDPGDSLLFFSLTERTIIFCPLPPVKEDETYPTLYETSVDVVWKFKGENIKYCPRTGQVLPTVKSLDHVRMVGTLPVTEEWHRVTVDSKEST